jgi:hypothetical protein
LHNPHIAFKIFFSGTKQIVLFVVFYFLIFGIWYYLDPSTYRESLEHLIISEQIKRARLAPQADYLLLGDSSCLMGIDPFLMSELLDQKTVESLCTVGYAGPAAPAKILNLYEKAGGRASNLLILLHPNALGVSTETVVATGMESMIENDRQNYRGVAMTFREKFVNDFFLRFVNFEPIPPVFMSFYGGPKGISDSIQSQHGTLTDPTPGVPETPQAPFTYALGDAFDTERTIVMNEMIQRIGAGRVRLGMMPIPNNRLGEKTRTQYNAARRKLLESFKLPVSQWIDLPIDLPNRYFATKAHLNLVGKKIVTKLIADQVRTLRID